MLDGIFRLLVLAIEDVSEPPNLEPGDVELVGRHVVSVGNDAAGQLPDAGKRVATAQSAGIHRHVNNWKFYQTMYEYDMGNDEE